jgi:hypothetical protein
MVMCLPAAPAAVDAADDDVTGADVDDGIEVLDSVLSPELQLASATHIAAATNPAVVTLIVLFMVRLTPSVVRPEKSLVSYSFFQVGMLSDQGPRGCVESSR